MYTIKNCYYKNSKLDEDKFKQLVKYFSMDLSASDTARAIGISIRSVNDIFLKIREKIAKKYKNKFTLSEDLSRRFFVEQKTINGQKVACFLCKTSGYIYTEAVFSEASVLADLPLIKKETGYSIRSLADNGAIVSEYQSLKDIAAFWMYAKDRLKKFKGIPKNTLSLHLKETEFRFNSRHLDLYQILLELIESDPI